HTMPPLPAFHVDFTYNPDNGQAAESASWIAAAQGAISAPAVKIYENVDFRYTLAALLVELKLEKILHARGWPATNRLTLFPFRPADAAMQSLTLAEFAALERPSTNGEPAWSLATLNAVALTNSSYLHLSDGDKFYLAALCYAFYTASVAHTN